MRRRNFISGILGGGLTVLPFIGKGNVKQSSSREQIVLTHKESRSGIRRTDLRIVISDVRDFQDSRSREEAFIRMVQKNRNMLRTL